MDVQTQIAAISAPDFLNKVWDKGYAAAAALAAIGVQIEGPIKFDVSNVAVRVTLAGDNVNIAVGEDDQSDSAPLYTWLAPKAWIMSPRSTA
jgi:hypothetical protein